MKDAPEVAQRARWSGRALGLRGRRGEIEQLDWLLDRAIEYQAPQLVTLVGGAGVGKSRLLAEWLARVGVRADPAVRHLAARVDPAGAPLLPLRALLRERFAIIEGDPDEIVVAKVRAEVESLVGDRRVAELVWFLGGFLEVTQRGSPFTDAVSGAPAQRDAIARVVLAHFVERDAEASPLVLAVDDLHHAEPELVAILGELGEALGGTPAVLVAAARSDLFVKHPRFGEGGADYTRIDLDPLGRDDAEALLRELLAPVDGVTATLIDRCLALGNGNPQRLEELVRDLAAAGALVAIPGSDRFQIDAERAAAFSPAVSVEGGVEARIGGLAREERELLEMGATFGNLFLSGALVALRRLERGAGEREPRLDDGQAAAIEWLLGDLVARDFLLPLPDSSIAGEREFVFKQNLERELLARTTPPDRARRFHRHGAQWLELRWSEQDGARGEPRSEEQLEALGALYAAGGCSARAATALAGAGDRARARNAHETATALYRRALEQLEPDDALARLDLLHHLGEVLTIRGLAGEALALLEELLRCAWTLGDRARAAIAHAGLGECHRLLGDAERAALHLSLARVAGTSASGGGES